MGIIFLYNKCIMNQTITIAIPKKEKERLSRLALNFGLSLPEFSRRVLVELNDTLPTESFDDYENPKKVKAEFNKAMRNLKAGRVKARL